MQLKPYMLLYLRTRHLAGPWPLGQRSEPTHRDLALVASPDFKILRRRPRRRARLPWLAMTRLWRTQTRRKRPTTAKSILASPRGSGTTPHLGRLATQPESYLLFLPAGGTKPAQGNSCAPPPWAGPKIFPHVFRPPYDHSARSERCAEGTWHKRATAARQRRRLLLLLRRLGAHLATNRDLHRQPRRIECRGGPRRTEQNVRHEIPAAMGERAANRA